MPGKVEKTCSNPHEGEITGIVYCPKTNLIYTSGGDLKVKVKGKRFVWLKFKPRSKQFLNPGSCCLKLCNFTGVGF